MTVSKNIAHILANNHRWATQSVREDAAYFEKNADGQSPKFMWIGCSDSRVSPPQICGLSPGDVFVFRNIANLVYEDDLSLLAALRYGIEILKVETVVVCGHYGCGGVHGALSHSAPAELKQWLGQLTDLVGSDEGQKIIDRCKSFKSPEAQRAFVELSTLTQVKRLEQLPVVKEAMRQNQPLELEAMVYDIRDGCLHHLNAHKRDLPTSKAKIS